ncbi:MAG TPA: hypothetical protein VGR21_14015, partial [Cryptosporangiaceae bacterium]|nr:hypothetical protein [Cryptosporangiaceae bacterium]
MTNLEKTLRDAFAAQVAAPPPGAHPVPHAAAIRRADSIRRRRTAAVVTAAAVAVMLVAGVAAALTPYDTRPPTPADRPTIPSATAVEYTHDGTLHTASGKRVPLSLKDGHGIRSIHRVPAGWIYESDSEMNKPRIVLVRPDGRATVLVGAGGGLVVAPQARRLAWQSVDGRRVTVADLDGDRLVPRGSTPLPAEPRAVRVVALVGDRVVLERAGSCCGGDGQVYIPPAYDTWDPNAGRFVPAWRTGIDPIYGVSSGGLLLVGLAPVQPGDTAPGAACVVLVEPVAGLPTKKRACDMPLRLSSTVGQVSPDGRWLIDSDAGGKTCLFDLDKVFGSGREARRCGFPETTTSVFTWIDSRTVVAPLSEGGAVVRWTVDGAPTVVPLPIALD